MGADVRWAESTLYDEATGPPDPHARKGPIGRRIEHLPGGHTLYDEVHKPKRRRASGEGYAPNPNTPVSRRWGLSGT